MAELTLAQAARSVGVSERTLAAWIERQPDLELQGRVIVSRLLEWILAPSGEHDPEQAPEAVRRRWLVSEIERLRAQHKLLVGYRLRERPLQAAVELLRIDLQTAAQLLRGQGRIDREAQATLQAVIDRALADHAHHLLIDAPLVH